jgi:hypothetical protein
MSFTTMALLLWKLLYIAGRRGSGLELSHYWRNGGMIPALSRELT